MKTMRSFTLTAVAVAMFVLAPLARAQVLQQVPSEALVVIKFNKLKGTSDKIGVLATKFGLAEMKPEFADPLGAFKKETKISQGLNEAGDAALVVMDIAEGKKDENVIALLPVSDYKAFVANFAGAKAEGDIYTVKFGNEQQPSFLTQWGNYAAIGSTKDVISKKPGGLTVSGLSAKELDSKDIVAFVNMKTARTKILPKISEGRAKFLAEFEKNFTGAMGGPTRPPQRAGAARPGQPASPPANAQANAQAQKFMPVVRTLVNRFLDVAEQIVQDADAAAYGFSFSDAGITSTALVEFSPQSKSAQRIAQFKQSDQSLLNGLPATTYLFYGGMVADPKAAEQTISEFSAPIEKELAAVGSDAKAITTYFDGLKKFWAATTGQSFGWVAPKGALGQEAIFQFVSVNRGDAQAMMQGQQEMLNSQQALTEMFMPAEAQQQIKVSFTPNAKTVDGVALNLFQTKFSPPAGQKQTPQQMQMQQMMAWMYGPNGMNGYFGAIGEDKLIAGVGAPDALLQQLVASAKADQDNLSNSTAIKAVAPKLPQQKMAVAYFAADQLATTIANYAKMFGMPINFQMPQNLPPVGMSLATEGSAIRADGYVPAQLVQSLVAAVQQVMMQMQGGQQPGGPGAL